jgi:Zn-dependent protease
VKPPDGIRLGRVLGVPVLLKPSWFIVAGAVTLLFAPTVRREVPEVGTAALPVAFGFAVLLLGSVLLHELAHAAAAWAVGNPAEVVVLDLWGGHTAFAQEATSPWRSTVVALAGPASNAVLVVLAGLAAPWTDGVLWLLLVATATANGFVAVFNALPGLPLDGGRVLEAVVWSITGDRNTGTLAAGWCGRVVAVGLVAWALLLSDKLFGWHLGIAGITWLLLVAVVLWQGATQAIRVAKWRRLAPGVSARGLLRPAVAVSSTATLAAADTAASGAGAHDVVVLDIYGRPAAIIDQQAAASVPRQRIGIVPASAVANPVPAEAVIGLDLVGERLIETLESAPHPRYVVLDASGRVAGILAWEDVAAAVGVR